jgi:hypothetical protein
LNERRDKNKLITIPSPTFIFDEFIEFQSKLPELCNVNKWSENELTYNDYTYLVTTWLATDDKVN